MRRTRKKKKNTSKPPRKIASPSLPLNDEKNHKRLHLFIIFSLFGFGIYQSILYFGHQIVPNPDFTAFASAGHKLLSLQLPSSLKRAPVLGLLQAAISHLVGGPHPDLTAGRLLNAILHPFSVVLLYLISEKIIRRYAAASLALIVAINPWQLRMLCDPIAETTLLFFVLLTFYLILVRSRWAYLAAALTTMVRYEGAALILAAFVMDIIEAKDKKAYLKSFFLAAAASVPLALWLLATYIRWEKTGSTYYVKEFGTHGGILKISRQYLFLIWRISLYPLFIPPPEAAKGLAGFIQTTSQILLAASFAFGTIYGLIRKNFKILLLLIFFILYLLIHVIHSFVYTRFVTTINWITLLVTVFGLQSCWRLINKNDRSPRLAGLGKPLIILAQLAVIITAAVWIIQLFDYLERLAPFSKHSVSIPYVTAAIAALIFAARRYLLGLCNLRRDLAILALMILMIFSNQFALARVVGNGQQDAEFKLLADWYVKNAKPDEKLLTSMVGTVRIFAPEYKKNFIHIGRIKAENPSEFAQKCGQEQITYIAWDSRLGMVPSDRYYKMWGMKNIAMLARPRDIGPYKYLITIKINQRRFINIFELRAPPGR